MNPREVFDQALATAASWLHRRGRGPGIPGEAVGRLPPEVREALCDLRSNDVAPGAVRDEVAHIGYDWREPRINP